jgi:hypothetical protein
MKTARPRFASAPTKTGVSETELAACNARTCRTVKELQ